MAPCLHTWNVGLYRDRLGVERRPESGERRSERPGQPGAGGIRAGRWQRVSQDIATGKIYTEEDFIVESSYAVKAGGRFDDMPSYTWPTMFAAWHGSEYVVPVLGMGGDMKRLNLRVMYADGETAVLYACAQFATAPRELEMLMAVSFADAETTSAQASAGVGGKQKCSACSGSGDCTRCGGTGRLYKTLPGTTERVEQDCTSCRPAGSGHCSFCSGTGYR